MHTFMYVGPECARLSAVEHECVSLPTSSCQQSLNTTGVRNEIPYESSMADSVSAVQAHRRLNQENFVEAEFPVENRVNGLMNSETDVKHV